MKQLAMNHDDYRDFAKTYFSHKSCGSSDEDTFIFEKFGNFRFIVMIALLLLLMLHVHNNNEDPNSGINNNFRG